MKPNSSSRPRGFTLLETVIAIGVLAVLLSGFMVVFTPAAEGIRKSINVQEADRLASSVEQELVTLRKGQETADITTGFNKSYDWIEKSSTVGTALLVYQYRGELGGSPRPDGTPQPVASMKNKVPGKDYVVVPMLRRKNDSELRKDLDAVEGPVFLVKCKQLVFDNGELKPSTSDKMADPKDPNGGAKPSSGNDYPEAVIAFSAEFHLMPSHS